MLIDKKTENSTINVTRSSMPPYEEFCEAIKPLWESHWLTNMGVYHRELENKVSEYLDVPRVSLMVNGHMALELAIQSFGFPAGSEVITTPFTFISTTHAIVRNQLKPVFCDVKISDGTIDENKIEELITPNTVAILPVHVYGHICNVDKIEKIAVKYGLKVIYDAAHAFGEKYEEVGIGNYGDVSIFSFHATKVYNTIEGGAVVCKNKEIYDALYNLKNFGIRGEELVVSVGANAKMNEFAAIMGLLNLKYINDSIADRKRVYEKYSELLSNIEGVHIFEQDNIKLKSNYAYLPILIDDGYSIDRNSLYEKLLLNNIHARKYFYPITADQACFKNQYRNSDLSVSRDLSNRILVLPLYENMDGTDVEKICKIIKGK